MSKDIIQKGSLINNKLNTARRPVSHCLILETNNVLGTQLCACRDPRLIVEQKLHETDELIISPQLNYSIRITLK